METAATQRLSREIERLNNELDTLKKRIAHTEELLKASTNIDLKKTYKSEDKAEGSSQDDYFFNGDGHFKS